MVYVWGVLGLVCVQIEVFCDEAVLGELLQHVGRSLDTAAAFAHCFGALLTCWSRPRAPWAQVERQAGRRRPFAHCLTCVGSVAAGWTHLKGRLDAGEGLPTGLACG